MATKEDLPLLKTNPAYTANGAPKATEMQGVVDGGALKDPDNIAKAGMASEPRFNHRVTANSEHTHDEDDHPPLNGATALAAFRTAVEEACARPCSAWAEAAKGTLPRTLVRRCATLSDRRAFVGRGEAGGVGGVGCVKLSCSPDGPPLCSSLAGREAFNDREARRQLEIHRCRSEGLFARVQEARARVQAQVIRSLLPR